MAYFTSRGTFFPLTNAGHPDLGPRILHVWNTAGVASVIAKFTDRLHGSESLAITRTSADRVGLTDYGRVYDDGPARFFLRAMWMARKVDIVHVHSLDRLVPWLKLLSSSRPVVMYYHGSDIVGKWKAKEPRWRRANFVAYASANLAEGAPRSAALIPDPVDTDLFRDQGNHKRGTALTIRYGADEEAQAMAKEGDLKLTMLDRAEHPVPYRDMPALLNGFDYYIDVKRTPGTFGEPIHALSKTALEALACGCKVMDWAGKVHQGLPAENDPFRVAEIWYQKYLELLASGRGAGS